MCLMCSLALDELDGTEKNIHVWLHVYFAAINRLNIIPQKLIDRFLTITTVPWELKRLVIRSIATDPTRTQMKQLVTIASAQIVARTEPCSWGTIFSKGPKTPLNESCTRLLANEAIYTLSRLLANLGDAKFRATFEKTSDAKAAIELANGGFR